MIVEVLRDALLGAAIVGAFAVVARLPARFALVLAPFVLAGGAVALSQLGIVHPSWWAASLWRDPPWIAAAVLAAWVAQGELAWMRARSWFAVLGVTVLLGDVLATAAVAASEPDPRRRARLVVAASGASLVGYASGAANVALGWQGADGVMLGLALAAIGFAAGPGVASVGAVERTSGVRAGLAAAVTLLGAGAVWCGMVSGAAELIATQLEAAPVLLPGRAALAAFGSALGLGVIGDEVVLSLFAREILASGLSLRGDWCADAFRVGLAVGGAPALLVASRSSLAVGIPLWLAQVALATGWIWWTYCS